MDVDVDGAMWLGRVMAAFWKFYTDKLTSFRLAFRFFALENSQIQTGAIDYILLHISTLVSKATV